MTHVAKLVEVKPLSDGALSVRARCCDDPTTDSCRTIYGLEQHTTETLDSDIEGHLAAVKRNHEIREKAFAYLSSKVS